MPKHFMYTSTLHKNFIIKDEIRWQYNKRFEFKDAFNASSKRVPPFHLFLKILTLREKREDPIFFVSKVLR